ncbi:MAG: AEC family transporter [Eubacteriales bacterium]|nr:AEC family transporter [Eubacteriales bacterium]
MTLGLLLFQQMISMMLIALMGYTAVKTGIAKSRDSAVLSTLLLYLITPCLIISGLQMPFTMDKLAALLLASAGALIAHLLFIGICHVLKKHTNFSSIELASMIYSNGGNLIIALVTALLGEDHIFYCCPFILVQLIFYWTHGVTLIGGKGHANPRKIITNPNIIALIAGLVLFIFNISLPTILKSTVATVGGTIGPVCMIMLGMIMAEANLKEVFLSLRSWIVCLFRLILFPLLFILTIKITGMAYMIPSAKDILMILLLSVCGPVGATVTQMASLFHNHEEQAGAINIMSVILSIVTMPLIISFYQVFI